MGKTLEFSSWESRAKGCRLGLPSTEPELDDEGIQWQVVYRWMHEEIYRYVYEGTCGRSKGMLRCFVCSVQKPGWILRLSPIQLRIDSSGPSLVCEEALKTWGGLECGPLWPSMHRKPYVGSLEMKCKYGYRGGAPVALMTERSRIYGFAVTMSEFSVVPIRSKLTETNRGLVSWKAIQIKLKFWCMK